MDNIQPPNDRILPMLVIAILVILAVVIFILAADLFYIHQRDLEGGLFLVNLTIHPRPAPLTMEVFDARLN